MIKAATWLALVLLSLLLGISTARRLLVQATVEGESMAPTLHHGDRVLGTRLPLHPRVGHAILFRSPLRSGPALLVKRVVAITTDGAFLIDGDGPVSLSSDEIGPIERSAIRAVAVGAFVRGESGSISFVRLSRTNRQLL